MEKMIDRTSVDTNRIIKGIGASGGIVIGRIRNLRHDLVIQKKSVLTTEQEKVRYNETKRISSEQIGELVNEAKEKLGQEEAAIFEAHLMMLQDPEFDSGVDALLSEGNTAEYAISETTDSFILIFGAIDDPYLRARVTDLKDIRTRLIENLMHIDSKGRYTDSNGNYEGSNSSNRGSIESNTGSVGSNDRFGDANDRIVEILYAEDLTPSDTLKIDKRKVGGFITALGSVTSHSAIMARTLGIPAIVATGNLEGILTDGLTVSVDGDSGEITIKPDGETLKALKAAIEGQMAEKEALKALMVGETFSRDGVKVEVGCNIGNPSDLQYVLENDGEGIGLYRSEFVYMDQLEPPSEMVQFEAYKSVLSGMEGKPVVIRTLDIGGDKQIPYMDFPKEENPFLGYRAVRYCLENEELFKTQLRALLRAGCHGNLKIMVPMISSVEEVRRVKALLKTCENELASEGTAYAESYEVGIMIEIPSAAIIADRLAKEVDFFSIGTNDLIQYTLAADRMNNKVAGLYSALHPAVLRLIKRVIDEGHKAGKWVGMCGEAAGDPKMIPILLGMGLDEFSMNPSKVLKARKLIQSTEAWVWKERADLLLDMDTTADIHSAVATWNG